MNIPRLCPCEEAPADGYADFARPGGEPLNAHVHEGCRVWHVGMTCTMRQEEEQMSMFEEPRP